MQTPRECYERGMQDAKQLSRQNVIIRKVKARGRSAFAARHFNSGDFICEYSSVVRIRTDDDDEDEWGEQRNAQLGIGCYCLDATYRGHKYLMQLPASMTLVGTSIMPAKTPTCKKCPQL